MNQKRTVFTIRRRRSNPPGDIFEQTRPWYKVAYRTDIPGNALSTEGTIEAGRWVVFDKATDPDCAGEPIDDFYTFEQACAAIDRLRSGEE